MDDTLISDLLTALGATLSVDDARAKLKASKLYVERLESDDEGEHLTMIEGSFAAALAKAPRFSLEKRRTREAASAARTRAANASRVYLCTVCETNTVDAHNGIETCAECAAKRQTRELRG